MLIYWAVICLFVAHTDLPAMQGTAYIEVNTTQPFLDEQLPITIKQCRPGQKLTVMAQCKDRKNNVWQSHATFIAKHNYIDVTKETPSAGTYSGCDAMGLFWSMQPEGKEVSHFFVCEDVLPTTLSLCGNDRVIQEVVLNRRVQAETTVAQQVVHDTVTGELFYTKGSKDPAVIVLPGSNGGIPRTYATLLANHGFAVLALGYFAVKNRPDVLENIDLSYISHAINWLKNQPHVNTENIGLIGISRGGEYALTYASHYPDNVHAVVAYVASNVLNGGVPHPNVPAWDNDQEPLKPFIPAYFDAQSNLTEKQDFELAMAQGIIPQHANTYNDPLNGADMYAARMQRYADIVQGAAIPVERLACPLLLFSGDDDCIKPSGAYATAIIHRLKEKGSGIECTHYNYPDAGHGFGVPYQPEIDLPFFHSKIKCWCHFGGTTEGNAAASRHSWQSLLEFLGEMLKST